MVVPLVRLSPAAGLTLITQISADQWRAQYPGLTWHVTADRERSAGCGSSTTGTAPPPGNCASAYAHRGREI
jgi:hypothetical protein